MPEYIDIHSHISFSDYDKDREAVIKRMKEEKVCAIDIGVDLENSKKASENAARNENIFASAGLHPSDSPKEIFDSAAYKKLFENPKMVAVGECGLDYYHSQENQKSKFESGKERQKEIFEKQIDLALELDKPLMLHCRDAYSDMLEILRSYANIRGSKLYGNAHFFAGDWGIAKKFLDLGFTLSFAGVITFARNYDEVIKNAPLDMILAETDSPFVAPEPYRGKRNEPVYVKEVVKKIAQTRGEDLDKVRIQILKNSSRVFKIPIDQPLDQNLLKPLH